MPNLARAVSISFVAKDGMSGSLRRMGRSMMYFQSGLGGIAATAGLLVAGGAIVALGKQFVDLGVDSVKAASDFETAFTGVLKTTENLVDSVTGELTELGETVKSDLRGMATEIPVVVEELARMAEIGGQLGIADSAIVDFTEVVAMMAASTNLTAEQAATDLARMASIFDVKSSEMSEFMDSAGAAVVALGNNFATTEKEILQSAMRLSGTGKALGLTESDVLGISTALASLGIQSRLGTTAVQKALLQINEAASATIDGFIDNSVAIKGTSEELTRLANNLTSVEATAGMTMEQMQSMRDSFLSGGGSVEEFSSTLDGGQSTLLESVTNIEALEQQLGQLESAHGKGVDMGVLNEFARVSGMTIEEFKKAWATDGGQIEVFQAFVNGLQSPAEDAEKILAKVGIADQQQIRTFLSLAGAGDKLTEAITMSSEAYAEQSALTIEAERRYGTFASQVQIMKNKFNDLKITLGEALMPAVLDIFEAFQPLMDSMGAGLVPLVEDRVVPALEWLAETLEFLSRELDVDMFSGMEVPDGVTESFEEIKTALSDIWKTLVDAGLIDMLKSIGEGLWDFFTNVLSVALDSIAGLLKFLADKAKEHKDEIEGLFSALDAVANVIIDAFELMFSVTIPIVEGIIEAWLSFIEMISSGENPFLAFEKHLVELGEITSNTLGDIDESTKHIADDWVRALTPMEQMETQLDDINKQIAGYEMMTARGFGATAKVYKEKLDALERQKKELKNQMALELKLGAGADDILRSNGEILARHVDISSEMVDELEILYGLNTQMSQAAAYAGVLSGHATETNAQLSEAARWSGVLSGHEEPVPVPIASPEVEQSKIDNETSKYASDLANSLKTAITSALEPTLDEVWQSPNDEARIDEWARRLATLTTDGLSSEWIPALEGQFGQEDWWQPIADAISNGDSSALNGLVTNVLTDNVTELWDKDVIKAKVREALVQDQLREALISEIAAELGAGGLDVSEADVGGVMGVDPTAASIADSVSSGLPVAMKEAGVSGTMIDTLIDDLANEEKRMEALAVTFAGKFSEALPDAMATSGDAFLSGVARSVAIKIGLEYQE